MFVFSACQVPKKGGGKSEVVMAGDSGAAAGGMGGSVEERERYDYLFISVVPFPDDFAGVWQAF